MTDNHTDDQHLLQQIERALAEGQASDDPLLDTLASTQPQPTPDFQTRLEARLMLAVQEQNRLSEEDVMPDIEKPKREPKRWSARLPLTLAAVIAITLMGGSALMFMNNLGGSTPGFAAQAETETPFVPELDPLFMTATAIIEGATGTAAAGLEQRPVDSLSLTATAIFDQLTARAVEQATVRASGVVELTLKAIFDQDATRAASTPVPIDPVDATSTTIIREATWHAATQFMQQTFEYRGTSEPMMATVTAIIDEATASAEASSRKAETPLQPTLPRVVLTATPLTQGADSLALTATALVPLWPSREAESDFQPILIARDTIRRGTQITADMLTTIYVPPDLNFHVLQADRTDMVGDVVSVFNGTAEQAAGQYAMVDIPALSPLLANDLVPENPIGTLPRGLSYPMTIYVPAEMAQSLTPGDRGQIITDLSALLTGFSADQPRLLTLVDLVEVLEVRPAEAGHAAVSVTMASNNDRQMLMDLLEWGVPLTLASPDFMIPAISDNGLTPTAEAAMAETLPLAADDWRMDLDENTRMVEVFIPLTDAPDNLIIGDNVGIQAEMNFRETANQTRIEIIPPAPQSSYRFYRIVAQPELLRVEANGLVVSMSQLEAVELSSALDAGLSLSLAYR